MIAVKRGFLNLLPLAALAFAPLPASTATTLFSDTFSPASPQSFTAISTGPYTVQDQNPAVPSTWTAQTVSPGVGKLTYGRSASTPPAVDGNSYNYLTSVMLTSGSTPSTGSTTGLTYFTVSGIIHDIPDGNLDQPGLVVSGDVTDGGYLLEDDNGAGNAFVLLRESGGQMLGDEGSGILHTFQKPTVGNSYAVSVTVDRTGTVSGFEGHTVFSISIFDLGTASTPAKNLFDSATFDDGDNGTNYGGTQIGYRVRNPLDAEAPSFGSLALSVPEPGCSTLLGIPLLALCRRRRRLRIQSA